MVIMEDATLLEKTLASVETAPKDGLVYLAYPIDKQSAFFACDGRLLYAVVSSDTSAQERIETQFISLQTGVGLTPVEGAVSYPTAQYDIIELELMTDLRAVAAFVTVCAAYSDNADSQSFVDFFFSLASLFRPDTKQSTKNVIGLYGELWLIWTAWKSRRVDLSQYWQKTGTTSKLDFALDRFNIEVKSTVKAEDLVLINHEQLFGDDGNYLFFVRVEGTPSGKSVQELADEIKRDGCMQTLHARLILEKELMQIEPKDLRRPFRVVESRLYDSRDIRIIDEIDERISGLKYVLNLAGLQESDFDDLLKQLNEEQS